MTVPVTGGSRSVDEETLHEFHLGFFGFIFTCNFIPVYFSPLPSSPCPLSLSRSPSLLFLHPLSAPLPFLLRSSLPRCPPVIWKPSPGRHSCNTRTACLAPQTRTCMRCTEVSCSSLRARCFISTRAQVPRPRSKSTAHAPEENPHPGVSIPFRWGSAWGPATDGCSQGGWRQSHAAAPLPGQGQLGHRGLRTSSSTVSPSHNIQLLPCLTDSPTTLFPRWKVEDVGSFPCPAASGMFVRLPSIFL